MKDYEYDSADDAKRLSLSLEHRRALIELATNKGFLLLNNVIQEQVDDLQNDILFNPCSGVDSAWLQEYKKGQLNGKLSWRPALETTLDSLEVTIKYLQGKIEDAPDDGTASSDRSP